eukprot:CAMPEP_0206468668 /NCGR_PEP_ID=MMETSP0324_2-20121206/29780_1 /ASSEMBLY_ACC=CAM_ASM_000836 /TAXON_ID=2866 /ORGANISM="Crypthecodinium cohnii, Strain Seligo" /LENGTH=538 /DNA_ID=CAMNT_0053942197 /DNA_START=265 /DNA_END=1881 /DNA_ORIENTATION=+
MGNTGSALNQAMERVGDGSVGKISVKGRYHTLPSRLSDDYDVHRKALGTGYNGAVYLATSKTSGNKYAVKAFKLHGVPKDKKQELISECEIFMSMDHPHVARLVDVYEDSDELSLVMECMEGGELFTRVTQRKVFSEKDAADASYQMLLAVNYVDKCGIVHRDLKLENFLYEKEDSNFLKLIDFGFSRIWDKNTKMELSCGTLSYCAPEVLNKSYTSQCDMWSFGVIVFILLVGYMPFGGSSERAQIANIRAGRYIWREERWKNVSDSAKDFVKQILVVNQEKRLTPEQALNHPWILNKGPPSVFTPGSGFDESHAQALASFARESHFRRAVMQLMAWSLTAEERGQVRDAFLALDKDNSGNISLLELKMVLENHFDVSESDAGAVFSALDNNSDGTINYSEFLAAMVASRLKLHDELLKATFRRFDTDRNGFITKEDFKAVLGPDFPVDEVMFNVDANSDGKISYEEFLAYVKNDGADRHKEAAAEVIDKAITQGELRGHEDSLPDCSPVRIRKRDRIKAFFKDFGRSASVRSGGST